MKEAFASRTEAQEAVAAARLKWDKEKFQVYALGDLYGWKPVPLALGCGLDVSLGFLRRAGISLGISKPWIPRHV